MNEPDAGQGTRQQERGDDLVREIARRVEECPEVAALSGGPFGTVATYLPGGRIRGVAVHDGEVEIAVAARYGTPLPEIAGHVRDAVLPVAGGRQVNVTIDELIET